MPVKRVAFVTVGQSPRDDILPEMLDQIGLPIEPVEVGLLDDLSAEEIARLGQTGDGYRIVSRLRDGSEVSLPKAWVEQRFQQIIDRLDGERLDLLVLLCTGAFPSLRSRTMMVEAGRVVDHMIDGLAGEERLVGMMLPSAGQVGAWQRSSEGGWRTLVTHASPYTDRRFVEAGRELRDSDLVVMHCMGYDAAMRATVAEASGRPVLLARGIVAATIRQLI